MLTWEEARRYHPNQRGIHQRQGEILSMMARFEGEDRKYHDQLLSDDLMVYIGEGDLSAGPQIDSPGNVALMRAKNTGVIFPVVVKWARNRYEYLGRWRVVDWEYSPDGGLPAHYRFLLQKAEAPQDEPSPSLLQVSAANQKQARRVATALERIVRDTRAVQQLKALYAYTCQVCNQPLNRGFGDPWVEGHHIMPLGQPHNGPDIPENIIILCPNHHALFDFGAIAIDLDKRRVIHADRGDPLHGATLRLLHEIGKEYASYHYEHIFKGKR